MNERPELVARMRMWLNHSQQCEFPYEVALMGHRFIVHRGVFSPAFYPETEFFAAHVLRHIRPGDRYLDVGCGIGVTATLAARQGASVLAVDVNAAAVENTRENTVRLDVAEHVEVRQSDIFSNVHADERFDVVFWNIPFAVRAPGTVLSPLEEAIFDNEFRKHRVFVGSVHRHLTSRGRVLVGTSSTLGDMPAFAKLTAGAGLKMEPVVSAPEAGTEPQTWLSLLRGRPNQATDPPT